MVARWSAAANWLERHHGARHSATRRSHPCTPASATSTAGSLRSKRARLQKLMRYWELCSRQRGDSMTKMRPTKYYDQNVIPWWLCSTQRQMFSELKGNCKVNDRLILVLCLVKQIVGDALIGRSAFLRSAALHIKVDFTPTAASDTPTDRHSSAPPLPLFVFAHRLYSTLRASCTYARYLLDILLRALVSVWLYWRLVESLPGPPTTQSLTTP